MCCLLVNKSDKWLFVVASIDMVQAEGFYQVLAPLGTRE